MTILLAAVDTGSLSAASRDLRIPLATVDSCRRIMEEIAEVERTASGEYRAPQGELIITAPAVLGRMFCPLSRNSSARFRISRYGCS
jgi:DNA-binding transcriptional LysR family regulator